MRLEIDNDNNTNAFKDLWFKTMKEEINICVIIHTYNEYDTSLGEGLNNEGHRLCLSGVIFDEVLSFFFCHDFNVTNPIPEFDTIKFICSFK